MVDKITEQAKAAVSAVFSELDGRSGFDLLSELHETDEEVYAELYAETVERVACALKGEPQPNDDRWAPAAKNEGMTTQDYIDNETLPAGDYYIGDPCYFFGKANGFDWGEVLDETDRFEGGAGCLEFRGYPIFCSRTKYGDGCYKDQDFRKYSVDSGMICAVPVEIFKDNPHKLNRSHEQKISFDTDFECEAQFENGGTIVIGHVRIETRDENELGEEGDY